MYDHKHIHCGGQLTSVDKNAGIPTRCKCGAYQIIPNDSRLATTKRGTLKFIVCENCHSHRLKLAHPNVQLYHCDRCNQLVNVILGPMGKNVNLAK